MWEPTHVDPSAHNISFLGTTQSGVLAAGSGHVLFSRDEGVSWNVLTLDSPLLDFRCFSQPGAYLYGATANNGVWKMKW